MKINSKYLYLPFIFIAFLFSRLYNLKIIPIFTDEAIYAYWAQIALHDPVNRFISLEDGKQPLFIWIWAIYHNFISDPLIAGRLVSVTSGFFSLIGIYFLSKEIFSKLDKQIKEKIAITAGFLYVILPFTLLYDRIALFDSMLAMFGIYASLFSIQLTKKINLEKAFLAGFSFGGALITKSSGLFFLLLLPTSLIFYNFQQNKNLKTFIKWFALAATSIIIGQLIYNSLRLSPLFYIIGLKNISFIRSTQEVIQNPFLYAESNFISIIGWIGSYSSWPLFTTYILGTIIGLFKHKKEILYLSFFIFTPFLTEVIFNKVLYARFTLFYYPYIIIIISYFIATQLLTSIKFKSKIIILAIILIIPLITSIQLLISPTKAKIPQNDSNQLLNSWPAGYGVEEIITKLKTESKTEKIYVGTEGTFGLFPFALKVYFYNNPNITIDGYWPVDSANLPTQVTEAATREKTYFIFNESQKVIDNPKLKLIARYQKGVGNSYMRLYKVNPQ